MCHMTWLISGRPIKLLRREILGDKSKVEDFVSSAAHKIEEAEDMEELSPESGGLQVGGILSVGLCWFKLRC